ncbi:MAG: hypothetical protein KAQ85_04960, partial [Thermodesulfovibrionia bacterium]|nr:hypothetical protein [Thermodesulfovibrionia bacterium]
TQAYLKRYFVAKETIDSLRRKQLIKKDTDILKLNDITDINPLVKNSVAPVQLKASDKIPVVIKLSSQVTTSHLFGLQLENSWKGKIEKIENIQFFLPEHIEIEKGRCTPFHMEKSLAPEAEGYSLFQMVYMNNPRLKNIERSVEQRCWILIKPENRDNILQPGDVTTRYFRMIADYTYGLEEKLKINVREEKGFSVRIASTDSKVLDSSSYVSCIVKNDEDIGDTVICTLFADSNEPESISTFCSDDTCKCDFFRPTDRKYPRGTSLRCDAKVEKKEYFSSAYAEVKNSPPEIKNIRMSQDSVRKGENIICSVDASDVDNDNIIVQFDFEGLNIASTQKECMGSCSVEIPTSNAIETTTLKCTAMAIDGKGDKSKELTAKAKVTVEAQNE